MTIGIITAVTAARTLQGAPFFLTAIDPPTVAIMAVLYVSVIIVAMSVPIARAMRLDPSAILRAE